MTVDRAAAEALEERGEILDLKLDRVHTVPRAVATATSVVGDRPKAVRERIGKRASDDPRSSAPPMNTSGGPSPRASKAIGEPSLEATRLEPARRGRHVGPTGGGDVSGPTAADVA